jgi:hypothetical protein
MTLAFKFYAIFCSVAIMFCGTTIAQTTSIKVGVVDYPPHVNLATGRIDSSPLITYMTKALSSPNLSFKFIKLPGDRARLLLKQGDIDLLLPINKQQDAGKYFSKPIFHAIPGLCFKKESFIPILSATHRLKDLTIGVPAGIKPLDVLEEADAIVVPLKGNNTTERGIELTQRGRLSAMYYPSLQTVYHSKNPNYKALACSYFHGYSTPVYIVASDKLDLKIKEVLEQTYLNAMRAESYEYFLAKNVL